MTTDDVDEVAVERAVAGDKTVPLSRAEHHAAWQRLERQGKSSRQIARILGVAPRTVVRWRCGEGFPAARPSGGRAPYASSDRRLVCPDCGERFSAHLGRHRRRQHPDAVAGLAS